jgi:hypothetical protein
LKSEEIEYAQTVSIVYDIYTLNGKLIRPIEERIYYGDINKYYKYSIFFPNEVKAKIEAKFFYEGEYYEYSHEAIITKKRNREIWSVW